MKKALAGRVDVEATPEESAPGVTPGDQAPGARKASKAKSFDDTPAGSDVPDGKYEAVIKEFVWQDPDEKGRSVRFTVVFATESVQGEEITGWFRLLEPDQETAGSGAKFFKRAVALLGYTDVTIADVEEICDEITRDKPGVLVQKKNNQGFDNVYFNGYIEDSPAIRALHESGLLD